MNFERENLLFCQNKKQFFGGFNKNLELVIPFEYKGINRVYEVRGKKYLCVQKALEWGVIELENYEYKRCDRGLPPLFNEDFIKKKNNKTGLINILGEFIIKPEFDEIKPLVETPFFPEDKPTFLKAKINENYGVVDSTGNIKTNFEYKDVKYFTDSIFLYLESKNDKIEILNAENNNIIFSSADDIKITAATENLFVLKNNVWNVLDKNGNKIAEFLNSKEIENSNFVYFSDDCFICFDKDGDYSTNFRLIDNKGNQTLIDKYSWIDPIEGGNYLLCSLPCMDFTVNEIIDKKGSVIISELGAVFDNAGANISYHKLPLNFLDIEDEKKILTVDENMELHSMSEENKTKEKIYDITNANQIFSYDDGYYAINSDKIYSINKDLKIEKEIEAELFDDYFD